MCTKKVARIRRALRTRYILRKLGVTRLVVHRSSKHIYAQIILSENSKVLVSAATVEKVIAEQMKVTGNKNAAIIVGKIIAKRAVAKGIRNVSFDRSGFKYHGRIQALANAAREFGLQF